MQCVRVICQVCLSAGVLVCPGGDLSSQRDGFFDRPCSQGGRAVSRSLTLWLSGLHQGCGALSRHSSRCVSVFFAVPVRASPPHSAMLNQPVVAQQPSLGFSTKRTQQGIAGALLIPGLMPPRTLSRLYILRRCVLSVIQKGLSLEMLRWLSLLACPHRSTVAIGLSEVCYSGL